MFNFFFFFLPALAYRFGLGRRDLAILVQQLLLLLLQLLHDKTHGFS